MIYLRLVSDIFFIFVRKNIMQKSFFSVLLGLLVVALFSCKAYKPVASRTQPVSGYSEAEYISRYKDLAISEMKRTGIPASITLAQGMIESDCGHSSLAREANNYFGIKCHDDWSGPTIRHHDDRRNECFRKYREPEESFYDHSDFLRTGSRYSFLFNLKPTDYRAWARGLKKAGYATNPDYANMLIRKIEAYNLMIYDRGYTAYDVSSQKPDSGIGSPVPTGNGRIVNYQSGNTTVMERVPRLLEKNRIEYIIVKDGDTKSKIEDEFQLLKWELAKYNDLPSDFQIVPGQILYLQPKRAKAEAGEDYYTTVEGDTMYLISQKYGIKLKNLYEMNRMEPGSEPAPGIRIWLRTVKPVN
jgi:LysM repeat protein